MILWVEFAIVLLVSVMSIVGVIEYARLGRLVFEKVFKNRKRR
ncbi:MAG TPA: hypothetical protein PKW30_00795 [Campylobacterales bacterium]|nr:hypothetical protein [Campylobacterales bacterium]